MLGALLFGDAVAGIVVAPFGWIIGRAVKLGAEAEEVSSEEMMEVQEGYKLNQELEEDWLWSDLDDLHHSPVYSFYPGNIW